MIGWGTLNLHWNMGKLQCIAGSCGLWEFPPKATDSPLATALTAGNLPAVRAVQGDCGTVYSKYTQHLVWGRVTMQYTTALSKTPRSVLFFFCRIDVLLLHAHRAYRSRHYAKVVACRYELRKKLVWCIKKRLRYFVDRAYEHCNKTGPGQQCSSSPRRLKGVN